MSTQNDTEKTDPGVVRLSDLANREQLPNPGRAVAPVPGRHAAINAIIPQTLADVMMIARGVFESGLAPSQLSSPEAIATVILQGLELGLPPMMSLNKIAIIKGRPTLWGDAIPALLWSHGFKIREWIADGVAHCEVTRPTGYVIERSFSEEDAKKAGLWDQRETVKRQIKGVWKDVPNDSPWFKYPQRMLQMRARAFAARDGAADVLGGLYMTEEIDGGELQPMDGNSPAFVRKSSAEGKRDGSVKVFNSILADIKAAEDKEALMLIRVNHMDAASGTPWADMPRAWADTIEQDWMLKAQDLGFDLEGDA